jgi:hypothetical protein
MKYIGVHTYNCLKCSEPVIISQFPDIRTGEHNRYFERLFNSKLCQKCDIEAKIGTSAENLIGMLC